MSTRSGIRAVVVVVPAHNEAATMARCVAAIGTARDKVRSDDPEVVVRTVVVADACTDETATIARDAGATVVEVSYRNVGAARASGCDAALALLEGVPAETIWIANTDADSVVPSHWLTDQIARARSGDHAVVGTVQIAHGILDLSVRSRWESAYALGGTLSGPTAHGHVHGANLGIRADVYRELGGFESLPEHEDHHLVIRLMAGGHLVSWPTDIAVITAARTNGRSPGGFSAHLAALHDDDVTMLDTVGGVSAL